MDLLATNNNTIKLLLQKYKNDGKLSVDEFINLIEALLNEKHRSGEATAIHNLINGNVPHGWEAVACLNCYKSIRGSIVDPANTMWITLSHKNVPLSHGALGMPCA